MRLRSALFAFLIAAVLIAVNACALRVDRSATSGDVLDLRFPAGCTPVESTGGSEEGGDASGGRAVAPPVVK